MIDTSDAVWMEIILDDATFQFLFTQYNFRILYSTEMGPSSKETSFQDLEESESI